MDDAQGGGGGGGDAEELILRMVSAHADSLLRTARRFSLCPDDAQDAYQRTLEIFMAHADRLDIESAAGWLLSTQAIVVSGGRYPSRNVTGVAYLTLTNAAGR